MISVIMAIYKEPKETLINSVNSILSQTYKDLELIIISDDPNNKEHHKLIIEFMNNDDRITFICNEHNLGPAETRNKGIQVATGEYIAIMDADDFSFPNRLEKQLNYLETNGFDFIGGIPIMIDENGNTIYSIQKVPTNENVMKKCLGISQCVAHSTWLVKKEIYSVLGGYREIPLSEDFDFTLRASLLGYRISNLNEPVLSYRVTQSSVSRDNMYKQYLYLKYLTNEYKLGRVANVEDAKRYVVLNMDTKKAHSFSKSNTIFNRMLKEKTEHKYVPFFIDGFRLLFGSREFLDKVYRFFLLTINS